MITWAANHLEISRIERIVSRAVHMGIARSSRDNPTLDLTMDLEAVHCNGCPIELEQLLQAKKSDFIHDIMGIQSHLNRKTGELEGGFVPRYAMPDPTTA